MERLITELKKNDRIKGKYAILQVINNEKNGLLTLYNEKTGEFVENDLRKFAKRKAKVEIL